MKNINNTKPMKEYSLSWFSPTEGKNTVLNHRTTNNPKDVLFNFACTMIVMSELWFGCLAIDSIRNNIKTGTTSREHYWIEFESGEVLSCMETIKD